MRVCDALSSVGIRNDAGRSTNTCEFDELLPFSREDALGEINKMKVDMKKQTKDRQDKGK
jgi:hypothetical protein